MNWFQSITILLVALLGWLVSFFFNMKRNLHVLQLEDYEPARAIAVESRRPYFQRLFGPEVIAGVVVIISSLAMFRISRSIAGMWSSAFEINCSIVGMWSPAFESWRVLTVFGLSAWGLLYLWRGLRVRKRLKTAKKPLVITPRARRIIITGIVIGLLVFVIQYIISLNTFWKSVCITPLKLPELYNPLWGNLRFEPPGGRIFIYELRQLTGFYFLIMRLVISMYFIERLSIIWLSMAVWALKPYENAIQQDFITDAERILKEFNPLAIGITGSYGKTGVKELLSAMLAEKYNVFRPPGSYNTLMGVTRIIRERLRPFHEVFVVEMGAYRKGSITKLCKLVKPQHGIITIIGVQHLERFKTKENIKAAKAELVHALPSDGIAVLNGDDLACREIAAEFQGSVVYFSVENDDDVEKGIDAAGIPVVRAENIGITSNGSDFDLVFYDDLSPPVSGGELKGEVEERISVHLSLLGRSAVSNACAAAAMADQLGVPRKAIALILDSIPHVKHRLEPIQREGGITVLDDAFNSNPIGAKNALEVLAGAAGGRRILVTPGFVELGRLEEEANYQFGKQAAAACDLAVLVGVRRIEPIRKGLLDAGFSDEKIWMVDSLNDGLERLKSYLQPGDSMLLENDLPDQYDYA